MQGRSVQDLLRVCLFPVSPPLSCNSAFATASLQACALQGTLLGVAAPKLWDINHVFPHGFLLLIHNRHVCPSDFLDFLAMYTLRLRVAQSRFHKDFECLKFTALSNLEPQAYFIERRFILRGTIPKPYSLNSCP